MEEITLTEEYINKNKKVEESVTDYLDNETDEENNFIIIQQIVDNLQIKDDKYELKRLLRLISQISSYHHGINVFCKIERILMLLHENIIKYFSNAEIFNIFKKNKRILLFLFDAKILIPDKKIFDIIHTENEYKSANYIKYFYTQFKSIIDEHNSNHKISESPNVLIVSNILETISCKDEEEDPTLFNKKQKIGENDNYICELIRNDSVVNFITYVNRSNIPLSSTIPESIFETNRYLLKNKKQTLIEYAAFFGSIQIFRYFVINKVELKPSIWIYAIHGKNADLIHLIEENQVELDDSMYEKIVKESIKCHYDDITKYIISSKINKTKDSMIKKSIQCYNYIFMSDKINELLQTDILFYLCKYDYKYIVDIVLKRPNIDINMKKKFITTKKIENKFEILNFFLRENIFGSSDHTNNVYKEMTLLYIATVNENEEIVELLLKQPGIDINMLLESSESDFDECEGNIDKKSALHAAVELGNINIVKLLLSQKNIEINAKATFDSHYLLEEKTALVIAIDKDNYEIANLLLQQSGIETENNYLDQNHVDDTYYIEMDDDYDEDNGDDYYYPDYSIYKTECSALFRAVDRKKHQMVKLLLSQKDIDVNSKSITIKDDIDICKEIPPLGAAIENDDIEMIKILLSKSDIDVNLKIKSINNRTNKEIEYDESLREETMLYYAVDKGNIEITELLLSKSEIDVNALSTITKYIKKTIDDKKIKEEVSKECLTVLHLAVKNVNIPIIEILLKHKGININAENSEGKKAIELTHNEKIKELFNHYSS